MKDGRRDAHTDGEYRDQRKEGGVGQRSRPQGPFVSIETFNGQEPEVGETLKFGRGALVLGFNALLRQKLINCRVEFPESRPEVLSHVVLTYHLVFFVQSANDGSFGRPLLIYIANFAPSRAISP